MVILKMSDVSLEYINCNLCNSDNYEILYESTVKANSQENWQEFCCTNPFYGKHGRIVRCRNCGLVYMNPRGRALDCLSNYKKVIDLKYIEEKIGRVLTYEKSLDDIEKIKKKGKILDVGCYAGFFLEVARNRGWEVTGAEPSEWASSYARDTLKMDVRTGVLKDQNFMEEYFDVVTLWDVLEHLSDPLDDLKEINRIMKRDGLLCLTTINIDSLFARITGKRWPQLMVMHNFFYTPATIKTLLAKAQFSVLRTATHTRILRARYLFLQLKSFIPGKISKRIFESSVNILAPSYVKFRINLGDIMTVYAKKKPN